LGWGRKEEHIFRSKEVKSRNMEERKSILCRSKEGESRNGEERKSIYLGVKKGNVGMGLKENVGVKRGKL